MTRAREEVAGFPLEETAAREGRQITEAAAPVPRLRWQRRAEPAELAGRAEAEALSLRSAETAWSIRERPATEPILGERPV